MPGGTTSRFHDYFTQSPSGLPLLPLTHTTDGWVLEEDLIACGGDLLPRPCQFIGEDILYLFYGRPTYRVNAAIESTPEEAFHSICFLIDPAAVPNVRSIFPFDTGAFLSKRYGDHLHPDMKLEHFSMGTTLSSASSLILGIYGDNQNYFMGTSSLQKVSDDCPATVKSYLSLISSKAVTATDARRSSIEIQSTDPIQLRNKGVIAVIAPEQMLDNASIRKFIENDLGAMAIGYFCIHSSPRDDMISIMREVRDFYRFMSLL
jgi:hypothetical protein